MGENALEDAIGKIAALGSKALIITGKHITASGIISMLTELLEQKSVQYSIFNEITGEPTDKMVEMAVFAYRKEKCDFIIGIGGGSPLDSAKACAAMSVLDGRIPDYAGKEIVGNLPPLVLIPTTAGTGSEVTKFTVITDTASDVKMLLKGEALLPDLAVVDPKLTYGAPKSVVAATGIDALTHAVEAYTSKKATPMTDILALSAIKRIFTYLPRSYKDKNDAEAHDEMAIAAYEAGICINNSSVTVVHGMSRPIGALFHVPHGVSNAMLIVTCLDYVLDGCYGRFAEIARQIGAAGKNLDDEHAAHKFIDALKELIKAVEIPTTREYGLDMDRFEALSDKMAGDALASGSPSNTRKSLSKSDILAMYRRATM
jgi:alcohol dehydrogenase class IV